MKNQNSIVARITRLLAANPDGLTVAQIAAEIGASKCGINRAMTKGRSAATFQRNGRTYSGRQGLSGAWSSRAGTWTLKGDPPVSKEDVDTFDGAIKELSARALAGTPAPGPGPGCTEEAHADYEAWRRSVNPTATLRADTQATIDGAHAAATEPQTCPNWNNSGGA